MNIYKLEGRASEIEYALSQINDLLEENEGIYTDEIETAENELTAEREEILAEIAQKPDGYLKLYKNLKACFDAQKAEKIKMEKRQTATKKSMDYVKGLLEESMRVNGLKRLNDENGVLSASTRRSVQICCDEEIAMKPYALQIDVLKKKLPEWLEIKTEIKVSKIAKDECPVGFDRVERQNLIIK